MHNRKACLHGFAVETKKRPTLKFPSHQAAKRLLLEKEEQRHERTPTYKKVGASDIKLAPTWCRWPDSNRHAVASGGF